NERSADAGAPQLEAKHLVHCTQRVFGRRVRTILGEDCAVRDRAQVDEVSASTLFHLRCKRVYDQKRAEQIGAEYVVEQPHRHLRDRGDLKDPRIVHDDVGHASQLGLHALGHAAHRRLSCNVAWRGECAVANLARNPLQDILRTCNERDSRSVTRQSTRNRLTDAARCARYERTSSGQAVAQSDDPFGIRRRNSSRVFGSSRNDPSTAEVTVVEFCFCTPRIIMHRCAASITTPTPRGLSTSVMACAMSTVRRSCTCSRREKMSTTRASLESPTIRPSGMYAMCAFPKNGSM